jgi:hypothetical protein
VDEMTPSVWARDRFGTAATDMITAVTLAIHEAHRLAMGAHVGGGLSSNDSYGSTLRVTQYEQLIEFTRDIAGVVIRKPAEVRSRFELVVRDDPPVVLYPWRYATDPTKAREKARLHPPVSDLRENLLTLTANTVELQLTLDQTALDPDQLDSELADEQAVLEQLAKFGQVVTVGFASNPSKGLYELGLGEVELVDKNTGKVIWHHWEELPRIGEGRLARAGRAKPPAAPQGDRNRTGHFDDAPLNDDLGLRPRPPVGEPPSSEPQQPAQHTGSDEPE